MEPMKKLTAKEMIDYLIRFNPKSEVTFLVVDPSQALVYDLTGVFIITDAFRPCFAIEVKGYHDYEEEEVRALLEDGRSDQDGREGTQNKD